MGNISKKFAAIAEKGPYVFEARMEVRDYECDIEGIVNNANYLHYIEHTRHLFLKSRGVSFAKMHEMGVDAVVARVTMQYKVPLRCDDAFISRLAVTKQGAKFVFQQDLFRERDGMLCFRSTVDLVCLVNGKLVRESPYDQLLL